MNTYSGNITPADDTIFVFGSNPDGVHGAGSAAAAHKYFGAEYGIGTGLRGSSYALPTTDIRTKVRPSIDKKTIINNIVDMYRCADENSDKKFKVAYRNMPDEVTLCGYSGRELMDMFKKAGNIYGGIPTNVHFSEEWANNWE